jgi:hypothetical protein
MSEHTNDPVEKAPEVKPNEVEVHDELNEKDIEKVSGGSVYICGRPYTL